MTIWILALVLAGLVGLISYYQGALRAAFSLLGVLISLFLAVPLGGLLAPLLMASGIKSPYLAEVVGPLIAFLVIMIAINVVGMVVHSKVVVWYKYNQPEFRFLLWQELNQRVGIGMGLLNAVAYLVVFSAILYGAGYLTYQTSSEEDPFLVRSLSRFAEDIHKTKLHRVVGAIDPYPAKYYEGADLVGQLKRQPLLQKRFSRYPGLFSLLETPEFQGVSNDEFREMLQSQKPLMDLVRYEPMALLLQSETIRDGLMDIDTEDLNQFLRTGETKYFDTRILGRWRLDINSFVAMAKAANPKMTSSEMRSLRMQIPLAANTFLVVSPDQKVFLKGNVMSKLLLNLADPASLAGAFQDQEWPKRVDLLGQGEWSEEGNRYQVKLEVDGRSREFRASVSGKVLTLGSAPFLRED